MSFELSVVLAFLGLDQSVSHFILILVIADLLTKWYSLVVRNYGSFSVANLIMAFHKGVINSHRLRKGVFGKLFMYCVMIFIASRLHSKDVSSVVILADYISQFIYTTLVISEVLSILENFRDCGHSIAEAILNKVCRKTQSLFEDDNDDTK